MLKFGSRGSPLAMTQAQQVVAELARVTGEAQSPIESFVTSGDRIADRRLQDAGGKGLFTKELDEALLDGRIDAAIHSLKDLPTLMPDGIVLAAIPSREDPRDAFISPKAQEPDDIAGRRSDRHRQPPAPGPGAIPAARPADRHPARQHPDPAAPHDRRRDGRRRSWPWQD